MSGNKSVLDAPAPTSGKYTERGARAPGGDVEVTRFLIDNAETRNSGHCMIAEAVKQAFPKATRVSVDLQTIRFSYSDKGERYVYLTPRSAQVALVRFDQELHTAPFTFRLRGGSVTSMTRRAAAPSTKRAQAKAKAERAAKKGAQKVKVTSTNKGGNGHTATGVAREGGRTPPVAAVAAGAGVRGTRRSFGLRSLDL